MTLQERKAVLAQIMVGSPFATGYQLYYRGQTSTFKVWEIPIEFLVYNQYNGRIGSIVKSYEKQNHPLNPEKAGDAKIIEDFLWISNKEANNTTLNSLKGKGQQNFGIVTSEGIIIDGNRRASLMNKIINDPKSSQIEKQRCEYFKAVILPENATKKDILRLETSFQMGEDAKVDYEPIEKYLKCGDLKDAGFTNDDIAEFMGIKSSDVKTNLAILKLMDAYLETYEYDGVYTMAAGHEDSFLKLDAALKAYSSGVATMWDITKADISNLKSVAFDYIRFNLPQNEFRDIIRKPTTTNVNSSIFSQKDLWGSFFGKHKESIPEEPPVDELIAKHHGENISAVLTARDKEWRKKVRKDFEENFSSCQDILNSKQQANEPQRLINKAIGALESIDKYSPVYIKNKVSIVEEIDRLIEVAKNLKS